MKLKSFIRAFLALVTVTYTGMEYQARYTNQSTVGSWKWMAIGKGTTAEDANHTALVNECTESGMIRALAILSYESSYKSVWTVTYTNNTGSTVAVEEAGDLRPARHRRAYAHAGPDACHLQRRRRPDP